MNRSSRPADRAETAPMHPRERGAGNGPTLAIAAMVVAIVALLVVLVVRATSGGSGEAAATPTPSGGGAASVFPAARAAADVAAQSDLQSAIVAATTFFVQGDTFVGFDAATASSLEPSLRFTDGAPAATGSVSIRAASADGIVLVERSASGTVFCIGKAAGTQLEGKQDATTPGTCSGGW